jgi:hypothetical protein
MEAWFSAADDACLMLSPGVRFPPRRAAPRRAAQFGSRQNPPPLLCEHYGVIFEQLGGRQKYCQSGRYPAVSSPMSSPLAG